MEWRDWTSKIIEQESNDVWLRTGIRLIVLLILGAFALSVVAVVENDITGDISGITRLSVFSFALLAIPGGAVAIFCITTGLIRSYRRESN